MVIILGVCVLDGASLWQLGEVQKERAAIDAWNTAMFKATAPLGVEYRPNAATIDSFASHFGRCTGEHPPSVNDECWEVAVKEMIEDRFYMATPERVQAERNMVLALVGQVNAWCQTGVRTC